MIRNLCICNETPLAVKKKTELFNLQKARSFLGILDHFSSPSVFLLIFLLACCKTRTGLDWITKTPRTLSTDKGDVKGDANTTRKTVEITRL